MSKSNNNIKKRVEVRNERKRKIYIKILTTISLLLILVCGIAIFNNKEEVVEENIVKELPLKIDLIPVTFNIIEENKTKVLKATFENDSTQAIYRITLEVKLKDTGEIIEMKYNEPLNPGETSKAFSGKAPNSGKVEDVEVVKYRISLKNGTYMEYNVELKQYNWS